MTGREERESYRDLEERYERVCEILSDLVESVCNAEHLGDVDLQDALDFQESEE